MDVTRKVSEVSINKVSTKLKENEKKSTHLYLNDKFLKEIPTIQNPKYVIVIYMHNNNIEKMNDKLNTFTNVTHLYLQWNKISRIENLSQMTYLKKLYLGHNCISVVEKLEDLWNLEELHIEKQSLECGEVICFEPRCLKTLSSTLQVLNISGNQLLHLDVLPFLHNLATIIAKDNKILDFDSLGKSMTRLISLREVDFSGNPMCTKHRYKETIIAKCPKLDKIDGRAVSEVTRRFLKHFEEKQKEMRIRKSLEAKKLQQTLSQPDFLQPDTTSADAQLSLLESRRIQAAKSRQLKLKSNESVTSIVPRCFWRNKPGEKVKFTEDKGSTPFDDFFKNTSQDWP